MFFSTETLFCWLFVRGLLSGAPFQLTHLTKHEERGGLGILLGIVQAFSWRNCQDNEVRGPIFEPETYRIPWCKQSDRALVKLVVSIGLLKYYSYLAEILLHVAGSTSQILTKLIIYLPHFLLLYAA